MEIWTGSIRNFERYLSIDDKTANDILKEYPECPYEITSPGRSMTSVRIDFTACEYKIICWYHRKILNKSIAPVDHINPIAWAKNNPNK